MKRRVLKYLVVGLTLLVLGALWAFSTFLFNPFEGPYEYDLSTLIPRDVDFYAAKADLRRDFDPLPRPAFADAFEEDEHGRAVLALPAVRGLLERLDVEEATAQLDAELANLPVKVDPLEVFGGRDLAVAGRFRGRALEDADWAVYGRVSRLGTLGLELVRSGLVDLAPQGITKTDLAEGFTLAGGSLSRPLHVTRVRDVVVVTTTPELVARVHELDAARGQDSFGQSAKYADAIAGVRRAENELEAYIDHRALSENLQLAGTWPDAASQNLGTALAGRLFQSGMVRELMTSISFGNGLTFHLSGQLSSEYMNSTQKRLYRLRGLDKTEFLELARMAPADCGVFAAGRASIGDLLRETMAAAEEAAITNLEDLVRNVWGYADLRPLIEELDASFEDRFCFFMRDDDYAVDTSENAPMRDGTPLPAWGLGLVIDDQPTLERIRQHILSNQSSFGIRGREPGMRGIFENTVAGGGKIFEYHNPLVPGTGHVATLEMPGPGGRTYFVLSNSHQLLGQVFVTYYRGDQPRLSEDGWFQTLVNTGLASADLIVWLNPRAISTTARAVAEHRASLDVTLAIDWSVERPRIEAEALREHFPGQSKAALAPEDQDALQLLVDGAAGDLEAEALPALRAGYRRAIDAWELTSGTLLELSIDLKRLQLYGRAVVPLD